MNETLALLYPWLKSAHIIFVIFWMAGLFMLPRFFIYQVQCAVGSDEDARWNERNARLLRIILTPSMIIVWLLGLVLLHITGALTSGWFLVKLVFVLGLSGYHGWCSGLARKFARGERPISEKSLRLLNEVPGIAAAVIVIMAVAKPL